MLRIVFIAVSWRALMAPPANTNTTVISTRGGDTVRTWVLGAPFAPFVSAAATSDNAESPSPSRSTTPITTGTALAAAKPAFPPSEARQGAADRAHDFVFELRQAGLRFDWQRGRGRRPL